MDRIVYSTNYRVRARVARRLHWYFGKQCPYCGVQMSRDSLRLMPSRDHRIPRSRGGTHTPSNITICCRGCNEDKGSLTVEEYMAVRAGLASRLDHIWNARRSMERNGRIK